MKFCININDIPEIRIFLGMSLMLIIGFILGNYSVVV